MKQRKRVFEYGVLLRPILHGTPVGAIGQREDPDYSHGVVQYDRPLSREDIEYFDLVPLDPLDPVNLRKSYEAFHDLVLGEFSDNDIFMVERNGRQYVLTWSTRQDVEWQVTHFDAHGAPTGHDDHNDFDKVVKNLWGFAGHSLANAMVEAKRRARNPRRRNKPSGRPKKNPKRMQYWWRVNLYETVDGAVTQPNNPFRRIEFRAPASWQHRPVRDVIDEKLAKVGYKVSRKLDRRARLKDHGGEWDWRAGASSFVQHPGEEKLSRVGDMERPFASGPGPDTPVKSVGGVKVIDWPNGRPKAKGAKKNPKRRKAKTKRVTGVRSLVSRALR